MEQVSEYLGIPYAKPPVGNLRFQPPVKFSGSSTINGSDYGHQCMQPVGKGTSPDAYEKLGVPASAAAAFTELKVTGSQSEDCLTLNVWTKPQTGDLQKAVLVWIHGGAFTTGSSRVSGYNGKFIVDQTDVIVISLNYRLNVFGFPGNPVSAPNLGLLDVRLAMEWIRDNVGNFGGDASRITLFGESAGGSLVDYYSYAYVSDPIAKGFILMSGVANGFGIFTNRIASEIWFNTTSATGCGNNLTDHHAVFDCMLLKNSTEVLAGVSSGKAGLGSVGGLPFSPTVDDVLVFADYSIRDSAKGGYLIGNNDNEAGLFKLVAPDNINETFWTRLNLVSFNCPAARRAARAASAGHPIWRYRYFGAFPNLAITTKPPSGAWHASELLALFDTWPQSPIANTPQQTAVGRYLRGAWATFARNPTSGLSDYDCPGTWATYQADNATLNRISFANQAATDIALSNVYDRDCSASGIPIN
ncbi:carboxylesterase [Colletotrichum higginsianum]|uniref:Carboxylic ester hydrolase n=1 Tax=Colletotrichum higginsianum (strain IMI 349063) TaxID=759273 RepID=H1VRA4_COLHI|nr:carboxylesterase [Colletotrichum higginsianum]